MMDMILCNSEINPKELNKERSLNMGNIPQNLDGHSTLTNPDNQVQRDSQKEKIILIADDDEYHVFIVESLLTPYNYKIIHAKNGEEAVEILKVHEGISLVLMDIEMPVMDGFTATKEIRKINSDVPVIAQTSYEMGKVREMALHSGCNDFIAKPFSPEQLVHTIEMYIA